MTTPVAVYVHIPFCPTKCGYCDFNSYAMEGEIQHETAAAIREEILGSPWRGRPAKTIFFGGGTPTYLDCDDLLSILAAVLEVHPPVPGAEITSESNPGTADAAKYGEMRASGFNRISLGAQSFVDTDLLALGRVHRSSEIARAVELARQAGFDNLNLDLMFALPGQSRFAWRENVKRALDLSPEHLSLYCLTLEQGTPFFKREQRGELTIPDEDAQAEMYEDCLDEMAAAGFQQYEISNFARPGRACAHNLCYWRGEEYAGYGPGAVGAMQGEGGRVRTTNLKHPRKYTEAVLAGLPTSFETEPLSPETLKTERIMLGVRLNEGLNEAGLDPAQVQMLIDRGWLESFEGRARLTRAGRHFCSEVALELI